MKIVGVVAVLLGAALVGCSGPGGAGARAKAPTDLFEIAQEELSHTIGTTAISSADLAAKPKDATPLSSSDTAEAPAAPAARTWGAAPSEQQSAESDLAANPYSASAGGDAPRDIYDPR